MRVLFLFQDCYFVEFDVEELVDGFENPFDRKIILEFHGDFLLYQCFEEGVEHCAVSGRDGRLRTYTLMSRFLGCDASRSQL